ncbi:MAG: peptide chain release factor-like protein [Planctomycetota bacterium]|nr:MAG: peptide chain release factor-like protein [Planctomycetota bacterium]
MHPAELPDDELLAACDVGRGRASGPGGQHRNKVETAVVVTHRPTGISAQASERRSQAENARVALKRLRLKLATEVRTTPPSPPGRGCRRDATTGEGHEQSDLPENGSDLWRSRRHGGRIVCNPDHRVYPALLAEALDAVASAGWEPAPAAILLGVSTSQLIKLVKDHPPAFERWNAERAARGRHALR